MRNIPDPGFSGDDGAASPAVTAALTSYASEPDTAQETTLHRKTLVALQDSRLLVPVVAQASDMATVQIRGRDGRLALLAFTGTDSLNAWNPDARPVPVGLGQAAQAALQDGAPAIVVDVAGPVMFVVEGSDLRALADGRMLRAVDGGYAWFARVR